MKTQTIAFNDFMNGSWKHKKRATAGVIAAAGATAAAFAVTHPTIGFAKEAVAPAVKEKVVHAFDPLVDMMISLSTPVAAVILGGASLAVMVGFKEKGYQYIMNASLGYVLIHMLPLFISLLTGVGAAIG